MQRLGWQRHLGIQPSPVPMEKLANNKELKSTGNIHQQWWEYMIQDGALQLQVGF